MPIEEPGNDADTDRPGRGRYSSLQASVGRIASRLWSVGFYQTLFYAYLAVTLLIFTFLVPPFQKSDEPAHYFRSVSLTNLDLVCSQDSAGKHYFPMKRKYAELPDVVRTFFVAFRYEAKFSTDWLHADFSDPRFGQEVPVYDICNLLPLGYLPNAIGVLLGKPFENPLPGFYLARTFGALFFVLAIVQALRTVPARYRPVVYFYAALPTVVHQVSAVSYDAVHLSLFPLIFGYVTRFIVEDRVIKPRELVVFMALLLWLVNIRSFAYTPLLLLFFLVPAARVSDSTSRYRKTVAAFVAVSGLVTAAFGLTYLTGATFLAPDAVGISASSQLRFVAGHPWQFVHASYTTVQIHGETLLRQGIGVFGWIDYGFNFVPYYVLVAIGGYVAYQAAAREVPLLKPLPLATMWFAIVATVGFLFLSLYLVWSPVGSGVVGGLQGRYFVGLLPFAVFAFAQTVAVVGKERSVRVLAVLLAVALVASMLKAVESRYY